MAKLFSAIFAIMTLFGTFVPSASAEEETYIVAPGDTLWGIAQQFGQDDYSQLAVHNGLTSHVIHINQRLRIPASWPKVFFIHSVDYLKTRGEVRGFKQRGVAVLGNQAFDISERNVRWETPRWSSSPLLGSHRILVPNNTTVYPFGMIWKDGELTYRDTAYFGGEGGWGMPSTSTSRRVTTKVLSPAEWLANDMWDKLIFTSYYDARTQTILNWTVLPQVESGALLMDVLNLSMVELHARPMPAVNASRLPTTITNLATIDWISGEEVTVTDAFERYEWIGSKKPSFWQAMYPMWEGGQVTRSNGEVLNFTGYYELSISGDRRCTPLCSYRGFSVAEAVGRTFYVHPRSLEKRSFYSVSVQEWYPAEEPSRIQVEQINKRFAGGDTWRITGTVTDPVPAGQYLSVSISGAPTNVPVIWSPPKGAPVSVYYYHQPSRLGFNRIMAIVEHVSPTDLNPARIWYYNGDEEKIRS